MSKLYFTAILLLTQVLLYGQNVDFKKGNFKDNADGFKEAKANLDKGYEYLEKTNEMALEKKLPGDAFNNALMHLMKANEFNPNNAELNFKIANALLYTNFKTEAQSFLDKAYQLDQTVDPLLHYFMGVSKQYHGEFDEAEKYFKLFEKEAKSKLAEAFAKEVKNRRSEIKTARELMANKERVWVDNVEELNSPNDDLAPAITADGETMFFSSNRNNGKARNEFGMYDFDIYFTEFDGKKWSAPTAIPSLNTDGDDVVSNLFYDGQKMLLYRFDNGFANVYQSKLVGRTWTEPQFLSSTVNKKEDNQMHASYNHLDNMVYYVTDQTGSGAKGGTDIFLSGIMDKDRNTWGKGQTIGSSINTNEHETSVYMHPDGQTMYFSSGGHNSMGGQDIFVSILKQGQWSKPINLGYPINSTGDDIFLSISASGKYAYIASNRKGGKGGMDIYKVTFWGSEKPVLVDTEDYLIASVASPIQETQVEKAVAVEKKSLTVFKGTIIDAISRKPLEADIDIFDNRKNEVISTMKSNSATGKFLLSLPAGLNYGIAVKKPGYLFHSENFDLPDDSEFSMVIKEVELKNIAVGSKIALRNIFFATGKSDIASGSEGELSRLIQLLNDVPTLKIEISGHTDNVGSQSLNQKLSEDRAKAVVDYLVKRGIHKDRLKAAGYGPSRPVATNDTEEGRQQNRRTEFEIVAN
jgi:outer membrane protein OmpA-like peptidoglycan-associated protein